MARRSRNKGKNNKTASIEQDPQREREARKYEQPIPSREFIMQHLDAQGEPMAMERIAVDLGLEDEEGLEALRRRLRAMERDGQLIRNRQGDYGLVRKMDLLRGRVIGHPDGFGFLVPDDGGSDLYLAPRHMRSLLHGDRVVAQVAGVDRRGRREGAVVEVLERANHRVVGRFHMEHGVGFVVPSNNKIHQDIVVPAEHQGDAQDGQIVVAEIIEQPTSRAQPIGRVAEILGDQMAPGMEVDIAIRAYELPVEWPSAVEAAIRDLGHEVPEAAKRGREDLRDLALVTIDGEDAKDFDDAIYVERKRWGGWRLIVAIADVSAYVPEDSALDEEAYRRGNSVYFPGQVVPMLPEVLSNGLCSLNPHVDRLCMACELHITAAGKTKSYHFFPAVMRSAARLTYTEVAAMVQHGDIATRQRYEHLVGYLDQAHRLYQALLKQRRKRGALDLDTTETKIEFGDNRKIEQIVPVERNDAHRLVEEFMIAANVAAGAYLERHRLPTLYRIHAGPEQDKVTELRAFLGEFGLKLGGGDQPEAKHYSKVLEEIRGRPDAHLIQTVLMRSLKQAVYSPDNIGHFGLAHDTYVHFTSPIRRYPDLMVHRGIRHLLAKGKSKDFDYSHADMENIGEHCSMTERRADEATRDAEDWLKCEFMQDRVGDVCPGLVVSVTGFGIFVELEDVYITGLIHVTALPKDYYHFDPAQHRLVGEHTHRTFRLGDRVEAQVVRVDLDERKIDLELAGADSAAQERARGKKKAGKKHPTKKAKAKSTAKASAKQPPKKAAARDQGSGQEHAGGDDQAASRKKRTGKKKGKARNKKQPSRQG